MIIDSTSQNILQMNIIIKFIQIFLIVNLLSRVCCYQIQLNYANQTIQNETSILYTLDINYNRQKYKLMLDFESQENWMKGSNCHICENESDQQCKEKCGNKIGSNSKGITCNNKNICEKNIGHSNNSQLEGEIYQLNYNITTLQNQQIQKSSKFLIVQKISQSITTLYKKFDGLVNLFHEEDEQYLFDQFTILHTDKKMILISDATADSYTIPDTNMVLKTKNSIQKFLKNEGVQLGTQNLGKGQQVHFSLKNEGILFPANIYKNLKQKIIKQLNSGCTIEGNQLKCKKGIKLDKFQKILLKIKINDYNSITFIFSSLFTNYKKNAKTCKILFSQSADNNIYLGQLFFYHYALNIDFKQNLLKMSLINNIINNKLLQLQPKIKNSQNKNSNTNVNSQLKAGSSKIYTILTIFTKVVIYLIVFGCFLAIFVNLYYNKKAIIKYFKHLFKKKQDDYNSTFPEEIDYYNSNIVKGYDIKNATKQFWEENSVEGI